MHKIEVVSCLLRCNMILLDKRNVMAERSGARERQVVAGAGKDANAGKPGEQVMFCGRRK